MTSSISSMSASSRATSELSVIAERESPGGLNWGMFHVVVLVSACSLVGAFGS